MTAFNDIHREGTPETALEIARAPVKSTGYMVSGHSSRLGQVVTNLLDNAISFSPKDGSITIKARRLKSDIVIAVEDEGPGIAPENTEKIFDRFYTDRPGEDAFGKNSGLGLNISRQIVLAHGGEIWAENRIDDKAVTRPSRRARSAGAKASVEAPAGREAKVLGARFVIRLPAV